MGVSHKQNAPYVLALTLLDASTLTGGKVIGASRVRYCVRSRGANLTHPDVVSVPTQRVPRVLAEEILRTSSQVGAFGDTKLMSQAYVSSEASRAHGSLAYAVENLLCRKLGAASYLERGELAFEAALAGYHEGVAVYANLNEDEQLRMINIRVHVTKGADLFPNETGSYDLSKWTTVDGFVEMWKSKDVTRVGVSPKDAIGGVCVTGLCISSTYDILSAELESAGATTTRSRPTTAQAG